MDYEARGMGPFTYEMKGKVMTMAYPEVPADILEQPPELVDWAHDEPSEWRRRNLKNG
jgi:TfoX/Sxy family transcriptional regulator of competence genes